LSNLQSAWAELPYKEACGTHMTQETQGVARRIVAFHLDAAGHWVADLDCGHGQHVRHDPPWMNREWVTTEEGRKEHVGRELICQKCGRGEK
jgi:hypothetical protein